MQTLLGLKSHALSDRLSVKIGNVQYFQSEVNHLFKRLDKVECLFGGTLQKDLAQKQKIRGLNLFIFQVKLKKYVIESGFKVNDGRIDKILKNRIERCLVKNLYSTQNIELKNFIISEIYFQEYMLSTREESQALRSFSRLNKLISKRFGHFIYAK